MPVATGFLSESSNSISPVHSTERVLRHTRLAGAALRGAEPTSLAT